MTIITLKINERTKAGKAFLEMANVLIKDGKGIEIVENGLGKPAILSNLSLAEKKYLNRLKKASIDMKELSSGRKQGKTLNEFFNEI